MRCRTRGASRSLLAPRSRPDQLAAGPGAPPPRRSSPPGRVRAVPRLALLGVAGPRVRTRTARQDRHRSATLVDLGPGGAGEGVRRHRQLLRQLAVAQDLDRRVATPDQTALAQCGGGDLVAIGEGRVEPCDVDRGVLDAVAGAEPRELGQATLQRHLAALEAGRRAPARAGALGAAASGLALAGGLATTLAGFGLVCPGGGLQMVDLHGCSSSCGPVCGSTTFSSDAAAPGTVGASGGLVDVRVGASVADADVAERAGDRVADSVRRLAGMQVQDLLSG